MNLRSEANEGCVQNLVLNFLYWNRVHTLNVILFTFIPYNIDNMFCCCLNLHSTHMQKTHITTNIFPKATNEKTIIKMIHSCIVNF